MNALARYLRRRYYAHRIAHFSHEVANIERIRASIGPALDHALRELGQARVNLTMLDIARPAISHAAGEHRRDGVRRPLPKDAFEEHA